MDATINEGCELYGDAILVEKIADEELVKDLGNGKKLYIPTVDRQVNTLQADKPVFVHVLAVGKGFYDPDTGKDLPLSVQPGDIILVGVNSVKWFSALELDNYEAYTIGLSRETEVQLRFKGLESYRRYFDALNPRVEKKI
jgi:co-chaperonin GroES (HSP10)